LGRERVILERTAAGVSEEKHGSQKGKKHPTLLETDLLREGNEKD